MGSTEYWLQGKKKCGVQIKEGNRLNLGAVQNVGTDGEKCSAAEMSSQMVGPTNAKERMLKVKHIGTCRKLK